MQVIKRNGQREPFLKSKLLNIISKVTQGDFDEALVRQAIEAVETKCFDGIPTHLVMDTLESQLMKVGLYSLAKELILFRVDHKPDIFRKRVNYKPFEYPELAEFRLAILNNFWLHTHYNYTPDVQDLEVNMPKADAETAKRAILAISQIEVKVKDFWGKIGNTLQKPEIAEVGAVFAGNEVVHAMAYSNLLEVMGLNDEFSKILEVPAIKSRVKYLEKSLSTPTDNKEYFKNVILFSMFIEHVSLFSQFYILLKYYKENKWLKGTSNAIKATSTEETLHAKFGFAIVNTIKTENPDWVTPKMEEVVYTLAAEAIEAEFEVLDWIAGANDSLRYEVRDFIRTRMNSALEAIGMQSRFVLEGNNGVPYNFEWFDVLVSSNAEVDFFDSKSVAYSKGMHSFDSDNLF